MRKVHDEWSKAFDKSEKDFAKQWSQAEKKASLIVKKNWDPSDGIPNGSNHLFNKYVEYQTDAIVERMKQPESIKRERKLSDLYNKESNKIVDNLVGKYGNKKLKDTTMNLNVRNEINNLISDAIYDDRKKSKNNK